MSGVSGMDFMSLAHVDKAKDTNGTGSACEPQKDLGLPSWEDVLENCTRGIESAPFQPTLWSQADTVEITPKQEDEILGRIFTNNFDKGQDMESPILNQEGWQVRSDLCCTLYRSFAQHT